MMTLLPILVFAWPLIVTPFIVYSFRNKLKNIAFFGLCGFLLSYGLLSLFGVIGGLIKNVLNVPCPDLIFYALLMGIALPIAILLQYKLAGALPQRKREQSENKEPTKG